MTNHTPEKRPARRRPSKGGLSELEMIVALWETDIVDEIGRRSIALKSLMRWATVRSVENGTVVLAFAKSHQFALTTADSPANREVIESSIAASFRKPVTVRLVVGDEATPKPIVKRVDRPARKVESTSPYPPMPRERIDKLSGRLEACESIEAQLAELDELAGVMRMVIHQSQMPYAEYLRTDWWQSMRKMALEAAGGTCQVCDSGSQLDVHHRTYAHRGFEPLGDLTVLCRDCHTLFHEHGRLAT